MVASNLSKYELKNYKKIEMYLSYLYIIFSKILLIIFIKNAFY